MTWKLAVEILLVITLAPVVLTILGSILVTIVTMVFMVIQFALRKDKP